jgi:hypothetical protein
VLTAVPLPDQPLSILWQSTVVDIEPGSRFGHRHDAAAINTTLAVLNDTDATLEFPLILATTDPEERDPSHFAVRVGSQPLDLTDADPDTEWDEFAASVRAIALAQGTPAERIDAYLAELRKDLQRAKKSRPVTLAPNEQRFIHSYQRKLLDEEDGVLEFRGLFPLPQFLLPDGETISALVMLPRSTSQFTVDLVDWTKAFSPQAFGKDAGLPQIAGRFAVSWLWQDDPELYLSYRYSG